MAMFGQRKPMFGEIPGMNKMPAGQSPMQQPTMGGRPPMGQVGAMDANTQGMTKKPGFDKNMIIGMIGDTLSTLGGGQGVYMPNMMRMQEQDAEIRARLQEAIAKRQADREDKQWEWQNKPQEERAPYRWEANDGSLMEVGPDGQPRQVYKDPTPKVNYQRVDNGDGTFTMVPIVNGQIMTQVIQQPGQAPAAPVGKLRPIGGQPGGTSPFVR